MNLTASMSIGVDLGGPSSTDRPYTLSVGPYRSGQLTVDSFQGREEISALYSFDLVLTGTGTDDDLEHTALGQRAVLTMRVGKVPRVFHGIVTEVRMEGRRAEHHASRYRMKLAPRAWLLKRRKGSRIFQRLRVDQVIDAVLDGAGIGRRWQLSREYPAREYCTQYEESDYRFITRILAESGIFFYFEQGSSLLDGAIGAAAGAAGGAIAGAAGGAIGAIAGAAAAILSGETIVFCDDPALYPPIDDGSAASAVGAAAAAAGIPTGASIQIGSMSASAALESPTLYHRGTDGMVTPTEDRVTSFVSCRSVRSSSAVYQEYDPERPQANLIASSSSLGAAAAGVAAALQGQVSLSPTAGITAGASASLTGAAGAIAASALDSIDLEVYEHHGDYLFPKWDYAAGEAALILRQKRRRHDVARGGSWCSQLAAGHRFTLDDHASAHLNRQYVLTAVVHHGEARPPRDAGAEAAAGAERKQWNVYRNEFECVPSDVTYCPKRPKRRCIQACLTATVVGPPGQEIHVDPLGQVKVQFHWDRVGGRDDASSCWIRTMQTWGGPGWGTQFIPRIGMEVVITFEGGDPDKPLILGCVYNGTHPPSFSLPAEKTRSGIRTQTTPGGRGFNELSFDDNAHEEQIYLHAQKDLDEVVENDHTLLVKRDETITVGRSQVQTIGEDQTERVLGKRTATVERDQTIQIHGNCIDVVSGNADRRVQGDLTTRVGGRERREITGTAELVAADDLTTRVHGCQTTLVGKHDAQRSYLVHVEGVSQLSSSGMTEIISEKGILLRCGKSSLRIMPDKIELLSASTSVTGGGGALAIAEDSLKIRAKGDALVIAEKMLLKSSDATVALSTEVKLDGKKILLNSPESATDKVHEDLAQPTTIELVDQDGKPLPYQRYLITLGDGSEQSGMLDKDGKAELHLEESGSIVFLDLSDTKAG